MKSDRLTAWETEVFCLNHREKERRVNDRLRNPNRINPLLKQPAEERTVESLWNNGLQKTKKS